jgi:hypothetical protein
MDGPGGEDHRVFLARRTRRTARAEPVQGRFTAENVTAENETFPAIAVQYW